MSRIAVIGAGISGMTAAYRLSASHEVFLLEKEDRLGGHTHTVLVDEPGGPVPVDTGFIVYNEPNYPNMVALFAELRVASQPSDMSFSVSDRAAGFEYSSRGLGGFFADRRNLVRPAHYRLLAEILRFHRRARRLIDERETAGELPLDAWLEQERFTPDFRRRFLYPMVSAIWSTSLAESTSFPARMLARFFHDHGLLPVTGNPPCRGAPAVSRGGAAAPRDQSALTTASASLLVPSIPSQGPVSYSREILPWKRCAFRILTQRSMSRSSHRSQYLAWTMVRA